MWARVTRMQGPPDTVDTAIDQVRNSVLTQARNIDGFKGMWMLVDRETGQGLGFTLWESESAMRASEEQADRLRAQSAEETQGTVAGVERYEVAFHEEA